MGIFCAIVEMPAALLTPGISNLFHSRAIRVAPVRYDDPGIAIPFHGFSHEFQRRSFISGLRDKRLQDFAFMINSPPKIVSLPTDLHEDFVQVPLPLGRLPHSFRSAFADLVRKVSTETVHPVTDRFVADVDSSLVEQVFDITQ
jgi:hypothetical protein